MIFRFYLSFSKSYNQKLPESNGFTLTHLYLSVPTYILQQGRQSQVQVIQVSINDCTALVLGESPIVKHAMTRRCCIYVNILIVTSYVEIPETRN